MSASLLFGLKKYTGSELHPSPYGVVSRNLLKQKEIYAKKNSNTIFHLLKFQYSFEQLACRLFEGFLDNPSEMAIEELNKSELQLNFEYQP